MALTLSSTGTVSALPTAPYDLSDQGQTAVESNIPRAAYDAPGRLCGFEELNQYIAIMSAAYGEAPLSMIERTMNMCAAMLRDRNTGQSYT